MTPTVLLFSVHEYLRPQDACLVCVYLYQSTIELVLVDL